MRFLILFLLGLFYRGYSTIVWGKDDDEDTEKEELTPEEIKESNEFRSGYGLSPLDQEGAEKTDDADPGKKPTEDEVAAKLKKEEEEAEELRKKDGKPKDEKKDDDIKPVELEDEFKATILGIKPDDKDGLKAMPDKFKKVEAKAKKYVEADLKEKEMEWDDLKLDVRKKIIEKYAKTDAFKKDFGVTGLEDDTFKIDGKRYSYEEILDKTKEFFDDVDFDTIPAEKVAKYIKSYVNSEHFDAAEKSIDKKRKKVEDTMAEVEEKVKGLWDDTETKADELEGWLNGIDKKRKELDTLLEKDPEDEVDETAKIKLITAQTNAERDLKVLKNKEIEIINEQNELVLEANYKELTLNFPELRTDTHFYDILEKVDREGAKAVKVEDFAVANAVQGIISDYMRYSATHEDTKMTASDWYKLNSKKYYIPEQSAKSVDDPDDDDELDLDVISIAERHKRLLEKQAKHPIPPKSSPKEKKEGKEEMSSEPGDNTWKTDEFGY